MTSEEDPAILALLEYLNGCEAAIASAKRIIIEAKIGNSDEPSWNPSKIKWEQAEGASGPYERSEDINSLDHEELLKDLAAHQGKLTRDGYFYWAFQNGSTIGRKKRKA